MFNSWILHLSSCTKNYFKKLLDVSLRYTKSNLGSCYTVGVISATAVSEQHKLSKSDVVEKVMRVASF